MTCLNFQHMAVACSVSERIGVIQDALRRHSEDGSPAKVIVFCQTKREVDNLGGHRALRGKVGTLHGDVSQAMRESTLKVRTSRLLDSIVINHKTMFCVTAMTFHMNHINIPEIQRWISFLSGGHGRCGQRFGRARCRRRHPVLATDGRLLFLTVPIN